jgi:hypothetical protein
MFAVASSTLSASVTGELRPIDGIRRLERYLILMSPVEVHGTRGGRRYTVAPVGEATKLAVAHICNSRPGRKPTSVTAGSPSVLCRGKFVDAQATGSAQRRLYLRSSGDEVASLASRRMNAASRRTGRLPPSRDAARGAVWLRPSMCLACLSPRLVVWMHDRGAHPRQRCA